MKIKMTSEEQAVANEILNADTDWQTIKEGDLNDFSLQDDPYKLPEEAVKLRERKRFAFKWILNSLTRLREVTVLEPPLKWWICNRTNLPDLEKYCSDTDGAIHCKDQILVFKPFWMLKAYQDAVDHSQEEKMVSLKDRDGQEEDGHTWYARKESKIASSDQVMGTTETE